MPVHLEYAGRTAIIRLDNPPVNALSAALLKELREAIQKLRQQIEAGDVRAVVVTGNGPKSFVAGADITRFLELDPVSGRELAREGQVIFEELAFLPCPVIAAVNGYALGGGLELAMACDIRIAAANARLGQPEVNLGLIPGYGGTQRLARLVGPGKAKELIFTGETLLAEEALRIGLVDRVVPEGRALEEALRVAAVIDGKSPAGCTGGQGGHQPGFGFAAGQRAGSRGRSLWQPLCNGGPERRGQSFPGKAVTSI